MKIPFYFYPVDWGNAFNTMPKCIEASDLLLYMKNSKKFVNGRHVPAFTFLFPDITRIIALSVFPVVSNLSLR